MYYSQAGQDKWVHNKIGDKGFFVDLGAYDGIQTSNTFALELLGWSGICVEANEKVYNQLSNLRKCICLNKAVTDYKGICTFGEDRIGGTNEIECDTLNGILETYKSKTDIDYISMDIEGNEFTVLSAFDFDRWKVKLFTIEHNLYCDGPEKKNAIFNLMTSKGFIRVVEDVKCLDPNPLYFNQPFEDWYENPFYKS